MLCTSVDNFYLTDEELEDSPSRRDGISKEDETSLRFYGAQLVQEACILLKCRQAVAATGQVILQRFYCQRSFKDYNVKRLAAAVTYLAMKLEEAEDIRLRSVILVFDRLYSRYAQQPPRVLEPGGNEYFQLKDVIISYERDVLRVFGFIVHCDLPHKLLISMTSILGVEQDFVQKAWNVANDSLRTTLCVRFKAHVVASGVIFYASRILQVPLPESFDTPSGPAAWWDLFKVDADDLVRVVNALHELYQMPKPTFVDVRAALQAKNKARTPEPALQGAISPAAGGADSSIPAVAPDSAQRNGRAETDTGSTAQPNGEASTLNGSGAAAVSNSTGKAGDTAANGDTASGKRQDKDKDRTAGQTGKSKRGPGSRSRSRSKEKDRRRRSRSRSRSRDRRDVRSSRDDRDKYRRDDRDRYDRDRQRERDRDDKDKSYRDREYERRDRDRDRERERERDRDRDRQRDRDRSAKNGDDAEKPGDGDATKPKREDGRGEGPSSARDGDRGASGRRNDDRRKDDRNRDRRKGEDDRDRRQDRDTSRGGDAGRDSGRDRERDRDSSRARQSSAAPEQRGGSARPSTYVQSGAVRKDRERDESRSGSPSPRDSGGDDNDDGSGGRRQRQPDMDPIGEEDDEQDKNFSGDGGRARRQGGSASRDQDNDDADDDAGNGDEPMLAAEDDQEHSSQEMDMPAP